MEFSKLTTCKIFIILSNPRTQNHLSKVYGAIATGMVTMFLAGYIASVGIIHEAMVGVVFIFSLISELVILFSVYIHFNSFRPINQHLTSLSLPTFIPIQSYSDLYLVSL